MPTHETAALIAALGRGRPVTIGQAMDAGLSRGAIRSALIAGDLEKVDRGIVIPRVDFDDEDRGRSRLDAYAARHPSVTFCSYSAAHLTSLPAPVSPTPHFLHVVGDRARRRGAAWQHVYPEDVLLTERTNGVDVTESILTAADIACDHALPLALIAMEAALRREVMKHPAASDLVDHMAVRQDAAIAPGRHRLDRIVDAFRGRRGAHRLREVSAVASPLSESPAESYSHGRLIGWGFHVEQQVTIADGDGVLRRVDFLIDDSIAGEVDGLVKYEGVDGRRRLLEEKRRDAALLAVGVPTARWTPAEMRDHPHRVRHRIEVVRLRHDGSRRSFL
jgi:hypothetical protein